MKTLLLGALLLVGCGGSDDANTAEDADESVDVTSTESALTSELADEVAQPASASGEDLASAAATRVGQNMTPAGCLTTTVAGADTTYVFDDCTGPYGLVHITGTVTATYSRGQGGVVQVLVVGTGVQVNQATLNLNATIKASQSASTKTANVTTQTTATGRRGITIDREGAYTVTYDGTCVSLDGTWTTSGVSRDASTVVSGYQRCRGTCPEAGGTIVHTTVRDNVITVTYDGSASAQWSTSKGRSGTVSLQCTAN